MQGSPADEVQPRFGGGVSQPIDAPTPVRALGHGASRIEAAGTDPATSRERWQWFNMTGNRRNTDRADQVQVSAADHHSADADRPCLIRDCQAGGSQPRNFQDRANALETVDRRPHDGWVHLDGRGPKRPTIHPEAHRLVAFLDKVTGAHKRSISARLFWRN